MTDIEVEIIKADYEHSEALMSEYTSNKSFAGAIAAISAFIILEWWKALQPVNPAIGILVVLLIFGSAILFLRMCFSHEFKYPSEAENWIDWKRKRVDQLASGEWPDTSEAELKHEYYKRLQIDSQINRSLVYEKQRVGEWAGILAMAPIIIVLIHTAYRFLAS